MKNVSKLKRIHPKEVWQYEDRDLTPWLCENIDVIGDAIGIQLTSAEREKSTGSFNVDIRAEDSNGRTVIIENQFGPSDHDHLGKLITYLTSFDAKIAVWIVGTPRTEHVTAINWLNESSNDCNFYLLKLEAIKIGDSLPAPLLTLIVGPSEDARIVGKIKKEGAENAQLRLAFWEKWIEYAKEKKFALFSSINPNREVWIGASSGIRGLMYQVWVNQLSARIELRIDRGKDSEEENLKILKDLEANKARIESEFGASLNWAELPEYRVCSIRYEFTKGGYLSDSIVIKALIEEMVECMIRLESATRPYVQTLIQSKNKF